MIYMKLTVCTIYDYLCLDVDEFNPNETAEATVKYDGSLGIAFLWNGEVMVTTRRRMNSEQALWAKQWINDYCNLTRFQTGYTYLFEIIYQTNTVIVNYLFEGLVLLAINDEAGHELPYGEVSCSARAIGFFMVTPRITAPYSELLWYCGGVDLTISMMPEDGPFVSGALPVNDKRQEGWVVKFKHGRRQKIVHGWWKKISGITNLVHPQIVWLLVRHDRMKEILGNVPNHIQAEIHRMIRALGKKFIETVVDVEKYLLKLRNVTREAGKEMYGVWRKSVQSDNSDSSSSEEGLHKLEGLLKLREQSENLDSDYNTYDNNVLASDLTRRKDDDEYVEDDSVMMTFFKLARKLDRYYFVVTADQMQSTIENVNRSPVYKKGEGSFLRLPALDHICPKSPVLDGYEPSGNFKQTWCKGWKTLPINQIQFLQEVLQRNHSNPPFLQLPVEVIVWLLNFLDGETLAIMSMVCLKLRRIVTSSCVLRKRINEAKKLTEKEKQLALHRGSLNVTRNRRWDPRWDLHGYSSEDSMDDYRGCGSY